MICVTYGSIAAAFLLVLSTPAFPSETLCSSSEEVVFSCQVQRGRTISVCASPSNQGGAKIGCPWPGQTHCKKYSDFAGVLVAKSEKLIARRVCISLGAGINTELLSRLRVPVSNKWPSDKWPAE